MKRNIKELKELLGLAKSKREQQASLIDEAYYYVLPSRQFYIEDEPTDHDDLFDNTAYEAAVELQTSIINMLIPEARPWAEISFIKDTLRREIGPLVVEQLSESNDYLRDHFVNSNFYLAIGECILDTIVAGTACIAIHDEPFEPLTYECVPLKQLYFLEDKAGNVDCRFREHKWTTRQLMKRFEDLPEEITETNPDASHGVIESVIPDGDQFTYTIHLENGWHELKNVSMNWSPFVVWRWAKSNNGWGDSPCLAALPSIRLINKMQMTMIGAGEFAALGAFQTEDESFNSEQAASRLVPGGIIYTEQPLTPIQFPGNYNITTDMFERTAMQIRNILLSRGRSTGKNTYKTATEIMADREAFIQQVGQPARRFQDEALKLIATQVVGRMMKRGEIPPFTDEHLQIVRNMGFDVSNASEIFTVDVNAAVKQASMLQQAQNDLMGYANVAQVMPEETAIHVNKDKLARKLLRGFGVSEDLLNSEETVDAMKEQISQMNQTQQTLGVAGQAGQAGESLNKALDGPVGAALANLNNG